MSYNSVVAEQNYQEFKRKITDDIVSDKIDFLKLLDSYLNNEQFISYEYEFKKVLTNKFRHDLKDIDDEHALVKNLREIIRSLCEKAVNKNEVNKWVRYMDRHLKGENSPRDRVKVFEISVILGFTIEELETLLRRGLFSGGLYYGNYQDIITAFVLHNKKSFHDYLYILNSFEEQRLPDISDNPIESQVLKEFIYDNWEKYCLNSGKNDNDVFISWLLENQRNFKGYSQKISKVFEEEFELTKQEVHLSKVYMNLKELEDFLYDNCKISEDEKTTINEWIRYLTMLCEELVRNPKIKWCKIPYAAKLQKKETERVTTDIVRGKEITEEVVSFFEKNSSIKDIAEFNKLKGFLIEVLNEIDRKIRGRKEVPERQVEKVQEILKGYCESNCKTVYGEKSISIDDACNQFYNLVWSKVYNKKSLYWRDIDFNNFTLFSRFSDEITWKGIKDIIKYFYEDHKKKNEKSKVFSEFIKDKFNEFSSEALLRDIYGANISDKGNSAGIRKNQRGEKAFIPQNAIAIPIDASKLSKYNNMLTYARKHSKDSNEKLEYPSRTEILLLMYHRFMTINEIENIDRKNSTEEVDEDKRIRVFTEYANVRLEEAGYQPIYVGNECDVLLMGALLSKTRDYEIAYKNIVLYSTGKQIVFDEDELYIEALRNILGTISTSTDTRDYWKQYMETEDYEREFKIAILVHEISTRVVWEFLSTENVSMELLREVYISEIKEIGIKIDKRGEDLFQMLDDEIVHHQNENSNEFLQIEEYNVSKDRVEEIKISIKNRIWEELQKVMIKFEIKQETELKDISLISIRDILSTNKKANSISDTRQRTR